MESEAAAPPAWLDFARLMIADLVARRRTDQLSMASATNGDTENADEDGVIGAASLASSLIAAMREGLRQSLEQPSPFSIIAVNAELKPIDVEVLALALAVETDPVLHRLVAHAHRDPLSRRLTIGDVVELLDVVDAPAGTSARRALLPDAPLRCAALIDVVEMTDKALFVEHAVVVPTAVAWAALGDRFDDPQLQPDREYIDIEVSGSQAIASGNTVTVITGGGRRTRRLEAFARCPLRRFLVTGPPVDDQGWEAIVREATITGRAVVLELDETVPDAGRRWIERARHLAWIISSRRDLPVSELPRCPWTEYCVDDREPNDEEWLEAFGAGSKRTHRLTHDQMDIVSRVYPAVGGDLDAAVRRLVSGQMEHLARRIRPTRTWDDIVLSADRTAQLRSIVDRYRLADRVYDEWQFSAEPSRGLVAAFSGQSGTGKTLATEVIAGALGLDVFKLDLSSVVSKYIGETEKNLEQIFDAASAGNLVLFFDEADALFGKRSEVKDARDRYANIEVSYLLQRLERYDGIVVLATNFEKNIDEAFLRRIHTRIEFAIPGPAERRSIWARNLPSAAPVVDVDIDWLADRFEISGGAIRNAAIHAAFLAATDGTPITMACTVMGVAQEFRKVGRLIKPSEFGDHYERIKAVTETPEAPATVG